MSFLYTLFLKYDKINRVCEKKRWSKDERTHRKNTWALFLLLLAGIVLGGFIGMLAEGVPALSWLSYGQTFGFDNPIVLNLGLLVITFGLNIKITIASILGVVISIIIYRLL